MLNSVLLQHLQSYGCHESIIKVGGFLLGEFGGLIADRKESSPIRQFEVLRSKHHICSSSTQSLLLSTYIKFAHLFLETRELIQVLPFIVQMKYRIFQFLPGILHCITQSFSVTHYRITFLFTLCLT